MQLQQPGLSGSLSPSLGGARSGNSLAPTPSGGTATTSALGNALTSSVTELADIRESESLNFQMADGTEVTIRMRAHATALGTSQTQNDGTTSSATALIASGRLQIEVKGHLSSDDLNAISQVVSQVDSLASQFFSGDAQGAFAAAASLNVDPAEIAGFSLKLSYSSELFQQATTNASAAAEAGAASTTAAPSTASTSGSTVAPAADSAGSSAGTTSSASPQQIIVNFVQQAMTKLRVSSGGAHDRISSHWKLKFLAQALPAYAQAQMANGTAPSGTASGTSAASGAPAQAAAAVQSATGATALRAARLAAGALNRVALP
jgi:hypothetical protein